MNADNSKSQMRKGILEYCIMLVLRDADAYASEVAIKLKEAQMIVVEGTLYPILTRLKNQGVLNYRWEESLQGPPRKYYSITDEGRNFLLELDCEWEQLAGQINALKNRL